MTYKIRYNPGVAGLGWNLGQLVSLSTLLYAELKYFKSKTLLSLESHTQYFNGRSGKITVFQQCFPNSAYQYQPPEWKATGMQYFHPLQNKPVSFPCQSVPEKKKCSKNAKKKPKYSIFFSSCYKVETIFE